MPFLGIDTSSAAGSVALTTPGRVLAEWTLDVDRTHAVRLLPHIRWMLQEAGLGLGDLAGIAVTLGPGSFTGLRIGIATAKTLALVSGKPLVGIPTLEVLAGNVPHARGLLCPVLDARRGEVYWALFRQEEAGRLQRVTEDRVGTPEAVLEGLQGGDRFRSAGHAIVEEPEQNRVRASVLCRLAHGAFARRGGTPAADLKAVYVRPSDAERNRQRGAAPSSPARGNP